MPLSKIVTSGWWLMLCCVCGPAEYAAEKAPVSSTERGIARGEVRRPARFPHRIWAAADFEAPLPDYAWFGTPQTSNIPKYPGNRAALISVPGPYQDVSAVMTGMNPVPGPRMGKENHLYLRYYLRGGTEATFQHFSLSSEDNNHIRVSGLVEGQWSEVTMNFSRDGKRNDGTPGVPFKDGERMDDLKIFAGRPEENRKYELAIDDVIFFANDPELPPEPEPFPKRVIHLAAFDTGPKEKYWPGDFEIIEKELPTGSFWRVAKAVTRKDGRGKLVSIPINPIKPVGTNTKLRFRYSINGSQRMTVQIFDATVMDNRHIDVRELKTGAWHTLYLDFTRDSQRNDGTKDVFAAGNFVDDIFFFVTPENISGTVDLLIDEVVLFDAGPDTPERP